MGTAATKLLDASHRGDVATVRAVLADSRVDVNAVDEQTGETALHKAAWRGYAHTVELLLNAGANVHAADENGWTPLHNAASDGRATTLQLLLRAGADPNATDHNGNTPLHDTCDYHHRETAQLLLAANANVRAINSDGLKPIHCCIRGRKSKHANNEMLQTLQVLVSFGATWDATCDEMVASDSVCTEARAVRVCVLQWTEEHNSGLPLTDVPLENIQRGVDNTQAYIDNLKSSRDVVLRLKICLVGCSCAGKTSFVKSIVLKKPQLVHVDDRTIGIDHNPLHFVLPGREDSKVKYEVTFWDFAGQDPYQVAHSLFFSPRTLFLVVIDLEAFTVGFLQASIMADVRKQEAQLMDEYIERTVMRWLRLILARQPDAEFVFVATKEDLLAPNSAIERLLKTAVEAKLTEVNATVHQMRSSLATNQPSDDPYERNQVSHVSPTTKPNLLYSSSTSLLSVQAARTRVEELIVESDRGFKMPDLYTQVLEAIVSMRKRAKTRDITTRIKSVFASVNDLPQVLKVEPKLCRLILQTLHDLGDVLWYENLGVEMFRDTVILDPLLLIDFIRQVINHNHAGQTMPHADLKAMPFWMGLNDPKLMEAMKQVLQKFHLVYSADEDRIMAWDSDMIVPAYWQTKEPASWLFLGDILRLSATKSCEGESVRVDWEHHFEFGLPSTLFDHLIVACVSPFFEFDAGPDWILFKDNEVATCRIMIGRDLKSLHRTIHVEAVVAQAANAKQADDLWSMFRHLCGALMSVMREYPGLTVSSFAWDNKQHKIGFRRLLTSSSIPNSSAWMPPPDTWEWVKQLSVAHSR